MKTNKIINGLALEEVSKMPDKSVDCVITSPPYWQLRDYGYPEQWGLEPTYQEYLEHLWSLMDEIWRVLKDDGTVWINLGDTYINKPVGRFNGGSELLKGRDLTGHRTSGFDKSKGDLPIKCLTLIPHRFAIGCIDRGWILRNDIVWAKRNGMPESVTDRFSKKHEYFFFMTKNQKYYFDLDGIRDEPIYKEDKGKPFRNKKYIGVNNGGGSSNHTHPLGKNPGDVSDFWDIPTKPSSSKHYASYNTDLIDKPIIAGCREGGIILDPFTGTGTTLVRAIQLNRNAIGIEGNKEYAEIAQNNLDDALAMPDFFNDAVNL